MKAVVLMDLANVTVPLSETGRTLDPLGSIRNLRQLPDVERISGLWAFADYQQVHFSQALQRDLMAAGFQLIQAPRLSSHSGGSGKATDDIELASHASWLLENCTTFDAVFLVSGDRDFLRVSQQFLNRGKTVFLVDPDLLSASRDLRNAVGNEVEIIAFHEATENGNANQAVVQSHQVSPASEATPTAATTNVTPVSTEEAREALIDISSALRSMSAEQLRRVLGNQGEPHHEQFTMYADVLLTAEEIIKSQSRFGLPSAFKYIFDIIEDEANYRTGGRVNMGRQTVPNWVTELKPEELRHVLTNLVNSKLLISEAHGSSKTYVVNTEHPFYRAIMQ
jgi:hypothetical protein